MANLWDKTMEEYDRALIVVRGWIREAFYSLDPYDWTNSFLSQFVKLSFLGFSIDKDQIRNYINQALCVIQYRPPYLLLPKTGDYVVHELLSMMRSESQKSLNHGVLFVRCVLKLLVSLY